MNFIDLFLALPLLCAAIAVGIVVKDRVQGRASRLPRKAANGAKGALLRSLAFLPATLFLSLAFVPLAANGQEVIHARAGQVVATDTLAKTLSLKVADGSTIVFRDVANPEPAMSFDKGLRDKTVAAAAFHDVGAYAVVFYFGYDVRTAVAVETLGTNPPTRTTGSVTDFDRHQHLLTLKADGAAPQKLVVSDATILDTPDGVVRAANFHPSKGQQLRCFAKPESQTLLFVALN